jgi:signal transduction histidine kinase
METGNLIERDVEEIYVPSTIYGVGGGGKEAVLQLFEQDWFAIEVMRNQNGTTNVYLVDTDAPINGVTVTCPKLRNPSDAGIVVEDTGAGIAPEHLPHVFERFYRTDRARSRDKGGSGLGLAIVRAIVEAHNGTVAAASTGGGSTFTIRFPLPTARSG